MKVALTLLARSGKPVERIVECDELDFSKDWWLVLVRDGSAFAGVPAEHLLCFQRIEEEN